MVSERSGTIFLWGAIETGAANALYLLRRGERQVGPCLCNDLAEPNVTFAV